MKLMIATCWEMSTLTAFYSPASAMIRSTMVRAVPGEVRSSWGVADGVAAGGADDGALTEGAGEVTVHPASAKTAAVTRRACFPMPRDCSRQGVAGCSLDEVGPPAHGIAR